MNITDVSNSLRLLATGATTDPSLPVCVDPAPPPSEPIGPLKIVAIVVLASLSGTFSGLNLGLLGLDVKNLELLTKGPFNSVEEETDAKYA